MKILNTAHLAFNVGDMEKTLYFYCECLGLKQKFVLGFDCVLDDMIKNMEKDGPLTEERLKQIESMKDKPWLTYIEVAPHQYIELFYTYRPMDKKINDPMQNQIGYIHLSLEVDDIYATREELIAKGVQVTEITMGQDHTWQMWLADPDGNPIELMQYTDMSLQMVGKM